MERTTNGSSPVDGPNLYGGLKPPPPVGSLAVGQVIHLDGDVREVVGFPRNSEQDPMVLWISHKYRESYGVTHPKEVIRWIQCELLYKTGEGPLANPP